MELNPDSFPKIDLLNRESFAQKIATAIVYSVQQQSDGFVTAVTGKWGSGKSTLLEYLRKEIKTQCHDEGIAFIIMEFNPWMFTDSTRLCSSFLSSSTSYCFLSTDLHLSNPLKNQFDRALFLFRGIAGNEQ